MLWFMMQRISTNVVRRHVVVQHRCVQTIIRRRQRPIFDKASTVAGTMFPKQQQTSSSTPHQSDPYNATSHDKSTLSPWVPLPDAVARKALDMAKASADDIHVDLGSGDGRVNFHAVDGFGVKHSIGIEVDETLVEAAQLRLRKRHPLPTNLQFITADLLSDNWEEPNNIWLNVIPHATIVTFFFAKPEMIRSRLEASLTGKKCTIVSCGYEVPGWESISEEVILGTTIYVYEFGGDNPSTFRGEDLISHLPKNALAASQQTFNKFSGANVVDHTGKYPIRGFNPNSLDDGEDEDEDWDAVHEKEDKAKETVTVDTSSASKDTSIAANDTPTRGCGKKA